MTRWGWWIASDAGLAARIALGAAFFLVLAAVDLYRRGRRATRWREYAFLLLATLVAMIYGAANDRIAVGISWEYFYYGKGLGLQIASDPGDSLQLHRAAVATGLRATWTVGLLIGAILLIANNPAHRYRPASYRMLSIVLLRIGMFAILCAGSFAVAGALGALNWTNADLGGIWNDHLFRPKHFLAVYGMNLGGYVGGAVGAVFEIVRLRNSGRHELPNATQ